MYIVAVENVAPYVVQAYELTASALDGSHVADLLSYLADSLALATPRTFTDHVAWFAGFLERRSIPRAHLADTLTALDAAITAKLPSVAPTTSATLVLAHGALATRSSG